jgi:hypothetical protein
LLSPDGSGNIEVFTLLSLLVCFSILWWHVRRDYQDLAIWGLECDRTAQINSILLPKPLLMAIKK